jgi:acetate kinase
MRDVLAKAQQGDEKCNVTLDVWAYGIRKYIGAFAAAMGGLDAIVFTAGIGENNATSRADILDGLEFLGVKYDPEKNKAAKGETDFSAPDSKVRTLLIPTDEELAIARDTLELTTKK